MDVNMHLNDTLLIRRYGATKEFDIKMRYATTRVTVGVRWSLPQQKHVPDHDVLVPAVIQLRWLRRNLWCISVNDDWYDQAMDMLLPYVVTA